MTDLTIGRLSATVDDWPDRDQVPRMLRGLAESRLQDAVRGHSLPPGEWCLRRVDVDVVLDPERPTSALEAEWADQIVIALRRSLRDGSRDVVRYDRREQAVDDLLAGLAVGDRERAWAWRQVGVLADDDPDPAVAPRVVALRVLARLPHGVAAAVHRLVDRVGAAAAHRLLGGPGWAAVADLAAREAGTSASAVLAAPIRPSDDRVVDAGVTARRAQALAATSTVAAALRGSSLRPDDETLEAWAVLILARSHPSALRRPEGAALVRALAGVLRPTTRPGLGDPRPSRPGAIRSAPDAAETGPPDRQVQDRTDTEASTGPGAETVSAEHDATGAPDRRGDPLADPPADGARTPWGGLLFLLNTAAEGGLPDALDLPPLVDRPLPWLLRQLAIRLVPAAPDDPAVLALSATDPDVPDDEAPPGGPEAAALDRCAARWAAATAARIDAEPADDDLDVVRRLAGRDALVRREPGWVEVVLDLDDVDLEVRRAGLDVDPGWVWWLGQVVRFRYE